MVMLSSEDVILQDVRDFGSGGKAGALQGQEGYMSALMKCDGFYYLSLSFFLLCFFNRV